MAHFPDSGFRTTRGCSNSNAKRKTEQPGTSSSPTDSIPPGGEIITIDSDDDQPVKLGRPSTSGVQKPVGALFALCASSPVAEDIPGGDISMESESATPVDEMEPIFSQIPFPENHLKGSKNRFNSSEKK